MGVDATTRGGSPAGACPLWGSRVRTFTNQYGTFQLRESLFAGPGGFVKLESTWQVLEGGDFRFTTAIPLGGP